MNIDSNNNISYSPYSKKSELSKVTFQDNRTVFYMRDSSLVGGIKHRALISLLLDLKRKGFNHILYASSRNDFTALYLSLAIKNLNMRCTIFSSQDHEYKKSILENKACIHTTSTFEQAKYEALEKTQESLRNFHLPFDLKHPLYEAMLSEIFLDQWLTIENNDRISEIWIPLVSGVVFNALRAVIPKHIFIHLVDLNEDKTLKAKVRSQQYKLKIKYHESSTSIDEKSKTPPPFQTNLNIDAKVWSFIKESAENNALWWSIIS